MTRRAFTELLKEDLAKSGITAAASQRNFAAKLLMPDETKRLTSIKGGAVPSYRIPYHDLRGKATSFYRVRLLQPAQFGFGAVSKLRYWQPPAESPHFYLPKGVPWDKIAKNPDIPIYMTEGEKKSFSASLHLLPCIGLGGVWNWRSKKQRRGHIPDFDLFQWEGRVVNIVFDNDSHTNQMVVQALDALCVELSKLGANPNVIQLPITDTKMGLDDFLSTQGKDAFLELEPVPYEPARELWALNGELAYCEEEAAIYNLQVQRAYGSKSQLIDLAYANRTHHILRGEKMVEVNTAAEWLKWPHRRTHRGLAYEPGQGTITEDNRINLWKGWGVDPEPGQDGPFHDLMEYLFDDARLRAWVYKWLAYPLQNPGTKMYTALMVQSDHQGTGKTLLGEIMGRIYGDNFSAIDYTDLTSNYNGWAARKQFILGDEISGSDKRHEADKLKNMLTRSSIRVNEKYAPVITLRDCANYYFTTNHRNALFLEDSDRRFAAHSVSGRPQPQAFYDRIHKWMHQKDGRGVAALLHHLLHEVDCADFNPKAHAPLSEFKEEMQQYSRSDLDEYIEDMLHHNPDKYFFDPGLNVRLEAELLTTTDITELLRRVHPSKTFSPVWVGRTMQKHSRKFKVSKRDGKKVVTAYLYAVQNLDHWLTADRKDVTKYLAEQGKQKRFSEDASKVADMESYRRGRKTKTPTKF